MKQRSQLLRRKTFERDNFTCQKCKIEDRTIKILEAHHIILLVMGGKDEINNLITLCKNCHHYAPNDKNEFKEYMEDEMTGFATTLIRITKKVMKENSDLFK